MTYHIAQIWQSPNLVSRNGDAFHLQAKEPPFDPTVISA
jgi:hypothetical protein